VFPCSICFALILPCSALLPLHAEPRVRTELDSGWQLRQLPDDGLAESHAAAPPQMDGGWQPAVVPGDVHLDLLRNGKIPDPFYCDNESKLQWIEKVDGNIAQRFTPLQPCSRGRTWSSSSKDWIPRAQSF
jgi:beta-mannosidase